MSELTPLNNFPFPSENEEPYFSIMRSHFVATDASHWALAENDNLIWNGGGNLVWNAGSGTLTWGSSIDIRSHTTVFKVSVPGPPAPGGEVILQDGEVAFFRMPRSLVADQVVTLEVGPITRIPGTRLHDIKILAARLGDTLHLPQGKSLKDGESGLLFGGGINITAPPHEHQPAKIIEPPFPTNTLDLDVAAFAPSVLRRLHLYKNGELIVEPFDYTVNLGSGLVTLVVTALPGDRYVALMETTPTAGSPGPHQHLVPLVKEPAPATINLDVLVTSGDVPALQRIDLFRNGLLQASPADYTIDLATGIVTLVIPTIPSERFVVMREVA